MLDRSKELATELREVAAKREVARRTSAQIAALKEERESRGVKKERRAELDAEIDRLLKRSLSELKALRAAHEKVSDKQRWWDARGIKVPYRRASSR
jgi:hypothetical protein